MAKKNKYKERVKTIDLKPFPYDVKLVVTDSIIETEKQIRTNNNDLCTKAKADESTGAMAMYSVHSRKMYILMPYACDIGYIAHEVWHIVRALLTSVGATLDNEVVAYYIGWLTREAARWNHTATVAQEAEKALDIAPTVVIE
jgi:hypothetical protein